MKLTETGEARVRGYLFVLGRSLRTFLDPSQAEDAVREVESHIRERLAGAEATDERATVEQVLKELGGPQRVAQAYSTEMTIDEAVTTGRVVPMLRAIWYLATTSVVGFFWGLAAFTGWAIGIAFVLVAPIKILFPNNVGVFYRDGQVESVGAVFGSAPGVQVAPFGYWVVPVALVLGVGTLVLTQWASRRVLAWMRSRRPSARLSVKVEVV
jgi:uncharacterized membrane protein